MKRCGEKAWGRVCGRYRGHKGSHREMNGEVEWCSKASAEAFPKTTIAALPPLQPAPKWWAQCREIGHTITILTDCLNAEVLVAFCVECQRGTVVRGTVCDTLPELQRREGPRA